MVTLYSVVSRLGLDSRWGKLQLNLWQTGKWYPCLKYVSTEPFRGGVKLFSSITNISVHNKQHEYIRKPTCEEYGIPRTGFVE